MIKIVSCRTCLVCLRSGLVSDCTIKLFTLSTIYIKMGWTVGITGFESSNYCSVGVLTRNPTASEIRHICLPVFPASWNPPATFFYKRWRTLLRSLRIVPSAPQKKEETLCFVVIFLPKKKKKGQSPPIFFLTLIHRWDWLSKIFRAAIVR